MVNHHADAPDDPVGSCAYFSRLIGSDPDLVLHGGGNSSVKAPWPDITGRTREAIFVKGSGWDMGSLKVDGLTALNLHRLRELLELDELSDVDMMRELAAAKFDPGAPNPSVETLLHAFLPYPAVQHSHADVIVTLTNLASPDALVREVYGDDVVVIPYVMPGFDLAREVRSTWSEQAHDGTLGMVLCNHGLFTFGEDSETAYRRHSDLIERAVAWLDREAPIAPPVGAELPEVLLTDLARLRCHLSQVAGEPMVVGRHTGPTVSAFLARPALASLAGRGPLTPAHVIRTKRIPMIGSTGEVIEAYAEAYRQYVKQHRDRASTELTEIDPAPRVVLDPELGMLTVGRTAIDARVASDIYHHTIPVLCRAEDHLGGYQALPDHELFDVEYWDLEQAKLRRGGPAPDLTGSVAVVTGAASGIGRACAEELLRRGAAVVGVDRAAEVVTVGEGDAWLGVEADVTDSEAVGRAVRSAVEYFGGIDIVVVAAGIFGPSTSLDTLTSEEWRRVMAVNVDSVQIFFGLVGPLLALSPMGGRVAVVGSKNVPAPGQGAAAYSASKAALQQLCRVAALEWAADGVRINVVHPDAVFDTGLWNDELIAERAAQYGLTPEEYRRRNLLSAEITSRLVARSTVALCTDDFAATTGAQVPIDGGSERVI